MPHIPSSSTQFPLQHDQAYLLQYTDACLDERLDSLDACGHTASGTNGHPGHPYHHTPLHYDAELSSSFLTDLPQVLDCSTYPTPYPVSAAPDAAIYDTFPTPTTAPSPHFPHLSFAHEPYAHLVESPTSPESFPGIAVYTPQAEHVTYPASPPWPYATTQAATQYAIASMSSSRDGSLSVEDGVPWNTAHPYPHLLPDVSVPVSPPSPETPPAPAYAHPGIPSTSPQSPLWSPSSPVSASSAASPSSSSTSETPQPRRTAGTLISTTPRRNVVARHASPSADTCPTNKYKCPYCDHTQRNESPGQLKRHIATHTRPTDAVEQPWVCCGVPLADAEKFGVPAELLLKEAVEYEGIFFVGGCWKTFSRRDALVRHLRRKTGVCYGDPLASYLPGNRKKDGR
ncbi:hypothetical protein OH77DRAFT_1525165 [Trametes cingulata]|nr:hypothetical protein OH77DRAFT_1525165 [Trametes cingulata]